MSRTSFVITFLVLTIINTLLVIKVETHHATVPASCTKAALLAEQNQLDWQRVFQAHADVENEALNGITVHTYRAHLAAIPTPPTSIDLGACK